MTGRLSFPVLWSESGGRAVPGRLDLCDDHFCLDGGSRDEPRSLDVSIAEIADVRIGRRDGERLGGRSALVVELRDGSTITIAGFDRPGALHELLDQLRAAAGLG